MIELNLVSPNGENFIEKVEKVEIKAIEGNLTILSNHISFVSLIHNGYVKIAEKTINIEEGVINFSNNKLYITYFK